jgi:hypothetical protein
MSKVNVEEVPVRGDHQVVVVSVAQTQHVRRDAVSGRGDHKVMNASVRKQTM